MSNYIVVLEHQGQPLQRLQLVARNRENAVLTALELVPTATAARVLEGGMVKVILLSLLLLPLPAVAQREPDPAPAAETVKPLSPKEQQLLDRIRKARDGDLRTFGTCSYRWDAWKLQAGAVRTTTYSCERSEIVNHTIGVSCDTLKINVYRPVTPLGQKPERWDWIGWRLPAAGGEDLMVASLCANALPAPVAAPAAEVKP